MHKHKFFMMVMVFIISSTVALDASVCSVAAQSLGVYFNPSYVKERAVNKREEGVEIKGVIPILEGYTDASLQSVVNTAIDNIYFSKVSLAKYNKAKSISFRYSLIIDGALCSILIYSSVTTASSREDVTSVNFDLSKNILVTVNNFFSPVALKTINLVISDRIKKNPERYNQAFFGLGDNTAFYTEGGKIIFLFGEGQIAQTAFGIVNFEFSLSGFLYFILQREAYYTNNQAYSIKMIPMRTICEGLGFTLSYTSDKNAVEIRKNTFSSMVYLDGGLRRFVEAQPENIGGVVYVPISFFDELPLVAYNVEQSGEICFATYIQ